MNSILLNYYSVALDSYKTLHKKENFIDEITKKKLK